MDDTKPDRKRRQKKSDHGDSPDSSVRKPQNERQEVREAFRLPLLHAGASGDLSLPSDYWLG